MLKRELSRDIAVGGYKNSRNRGYRSSGLERVVLERELLGDIAAGGYRSNGL